MPDIIQYPLSKELFPYFWGSIDVLPGDLQEPYKGLLLAPQGLKASLIIRTSAAILQVPSFHTLVVPALENHLGIATLTQDVLVDGTPVYGPFKDQGYRFAYYRHIGPNERMVRKITQRGGVDPGVNVKRENYDYAMRLDAEEAMEQIGVTSVLTDNFYDPGSNTLKGVRISALQHAVQILYGFRLSQ